MKGRCSERLAATLMVTLVCAVALSPRIRFPLLPERSIDLRIQDFLIPLVLLIARPPRISFRMVWGAWFGLFAWVAAVVLVLTALITPEPGFLVRVAYFGRQVEPFVLAYAVCRLAMAAGPLARPWLLRCLIVVEVLNVGWVGIQIWAGTSTTLFGAEVSEQFGAYGPRLIGEGSAFGAGAFFAFACASTVALHRSGFLRLPVTILMLGGFLGCLYVVQSRIWMGAAALYVLALLVFADRRRWTVARATLILIVVSIVAAFVLPPLPTNGRLSPEGLALSLGVRTGDIWGPITALLTAEPWTPLLGFGPGGLLDTDITEAHNAALRAWLDYGLFGMALMFVVVGSAFRYTRQTLRDPRSDRYAQLWADLAGLYMLGIAIAGTVQDSFTVVTSSHLAAVAIGAHAAMKHDPDLAPTSTTSDGKVLERL